MVLLSSILFNPSNPRVIRDKRFRLLVQSLKDFPEMMSKRPIVIDENRISLGGNQRLAALNELGYKEIPDEWVSIASGWTESQKRQFTIKDNENYGEWDWDILANEWDANDLKEWGVDVPVFEDFSESDFEENTNKHTPDKNCTCPKCGFTWQK